MEEVYESGQKELRIIDTLEPVLARGALIFNDDIARKEPASLAGYPLDKRSTYSLFHQMAFITRDKQSLTHDDRLDALASAVRYFAQSTLLKKLNAGDHAGACEELPRWNKGGPAGKKRVLPGLVKLRAAERELCLTPVETRP